MMICLFTLFDPVASGREMNTNSKSDLMRYFTVPFSLIAFFSWRSSSREYHDTSANNLSLCSLIMLFLNLYPISIFAMDALVRFSQDTDC